MAQKGLDSIEKLKNGDSGIRAHFRGGLPQGITCLVSGTAGSSKTVFFVQFLVEGIRRKGEGGVFVTFEESPADIRRNMPDFGWDIEDFERLGEMFVAE